MGQRNVYSYEREMAPVPNAKNEWAAMLARFGRGQSEPVTVPVPREHNAPAPVSQEETQDSSSPEAPPSDVPSRSAFAEEPERSDAPVTGRGTRRIDGSNGAPRTSATRSRPGPPGPPRISPAADSKLKNAIQTVFGESQEHVHAAFLKHFPRYLAGELESKDQAFFEEMARIIQQSRWGGKYFHKVRNERPQDSPTLLGAIYNEAEIEVEKQNQL